MCSYESIKSSIRLLLTSASNGLSLEQLNNDYQYYNQSENIPYQNFGYSTLFDFLRDMPDVAQIDLNIFPPIVFGVNIPSQSNKKFKLSNLKNKNLSIEKINKRPNKNLKRVVLNQLSNNNLSTEHIINQLTNLTMNQKYSLKNNEILTISIDSMNQCQIARCSNGKYYIPCFELSRILNINEQVIDKETMFSRMRIYQSHDLFNQFKYTNNCCQHIQSSSRPYFFLVLISSIIPVLKMNKFLNRYDQIVLAFERLVNV